MELLDPVGVRVERQEATDGERSPCPFVRQVEAMIGAIHLEDGASPGGLRVDRLPVEVEILAALDHPTGRVGDDVDMRAADRRKHTGGQLLARLPAADMKRGDDHVEPGEKLVLVVEPAIGPDLQFAAVKEPESLGWRAGGCDPGGFLGREPGVELGDDRPLELDPVGRQAVGDRQGLAVVGEVDFLPKVKIEAAIKTEMLDQVIEAIEKSANTGKIGDGKIFVFELEQVIRIRTGETGAEAI